MGGRETHHEHSHRFPILYLSWSLGDLEVILSHIDFADQGGPCLCVEVSFARKLSIIHTGIYFVSFFFVSRRIMLV